MERYFNALSKCSVRIFLQWGGKFTSKGQWIAPTEWSYIWTISHIHIPGSHSSATTYHTDFFKKYTSYISSRTKNFKVKNLNSKVLVLAFRTECFWCIPLPKHFTSITSAEISDIAKPYGKVCIVQPENNKN